MVEDDGDPVTELLGLSDRGVGEQPDRRVERGELGDDLVEDRPGVGLESLEPCYGVDDLAVLLEPPFEAFEEVDDVGVVVQHHAHSGKAYSSLLS